MGSVARLASIGETKGDSRLKDEGKTAGVDRGIGGGARDGKTMEGGASGITA